MFLLESLPSLKEVIYSIILMLITIGIYQAFAFIQHKVQKVWLNPMLWSIIAIILALLYSPLSFDEYYQGTQLLNDLLEPAVVALGYPLYQQLPAIKHQWKAIGLLLSLGVLIAVAISFILSILLITLPEVSVSLSLKSITTPIAIALTEQLNGDSSITAFAVIIAGLLGATLGPSWLTMINVTSPKAQGLAVGAASHAIGTAAVSKISYEHGAYSSLALIISAILTAILSPIVVNLLFPYFL